MDNEEVSRAIDELRSDVEETRLDLHRAFWELDRIARDDAMPSAEKVRRLRDFWDDFRWSPVPAGGHREPEGSSSGGPQ